jgi:membrane-bound lytic murein transglycosylase A
MQVTIVSCLAGALLLAGCGNAIVPSPGPSTRAPAAKLMVRPAPVTPQRIESAKPLAAIPATAGAGPTAKSTGVTAGPNLSTLPVTEANAARALKAFKLSCPALVRRPDLSGLTSGSDWQPACAAASSWRADDALGFFKANFEVAQIGTGAAFATGYYEPEIAGSRTKQPGYSLPIYRRPPELVEIDLGRFSESLKGKKIRGRVNGQSFVPYDDRAMIEDGSLAGRGLEIAWAKDTIEFFFVQVQGSGILRLPDGGTMKIGYDGQNGHDYTGIGKIMRDRGLLGPGQASMQGIDAWIRANPEQGRAIMRENKSWVFFRELTNTGALGALNVEVAARTTVAADPMFTPLGAPVFLSMDRAEPNGLWVAQDTGGAIKGANRFDTFWGAGAEATRIAGGMSAKGTSFLLLPIGAIAKANAAQPKAGVPIGGPSPQR